MWSPTSSSELYHHGILGMSWGKRNGPPYPLEDGAHSAAEKRAEKKSWSERRAEKKKRKQRTKALEKARKQRQKNKEAIEKKEEILRKGSAKEVSKIRDQLTDEDYRKVFTRLDNENKLDQRVNQNIKTGKERLSDITSTISTIATASQSAINLYNNGAKIYNTFNKKGNKLPLIKDEQQSKDKKIKEYLTDKADLKTVVKNKDKLNGAELSKALLRFNKQDELEKYLASKESKA